MTSTSPMLQQPLSLCYRRTLLTTTKLFHPISSKLRWKNRLEELITSGLFTTISIFLCFLLPRTIEGCRYSSAYSTFNFRFLDGVIGLPPLLNLLPDPVELQCLAMCPKPA